MLGGVAVKGSGGSGWLGGGVKGWGSIRDGGKGEAQKWFCVAKGKQWILRI